MAYALKYKAGYKTVDGLVKEIRLSKVDYAGPVTEWKTSSATVQYNYGDSDVFFGTPIVASRARLGFVFEEMYELSDFVFDRKTFFCEIIVLESGKVEWSGWIEPWGANHAYTKAPYVVSMIASCGLAHLKRKKYVNPNNIFEKTGLAIIQECLAIIGSTLYLRTSTHMKENSFEEDGLYGLRSFEINTAGYYDSNGEALYCDVIISDILNKFNAEILQWDNRWVIRSIVDHATGYERTFHEYRFNDGPDLPSSPWPGTYLVNDGIKSLSLAGGQISILAPINKYRTEVDLGSQVPFFANGNMVLWSDAGLVGWDFSHMPKGNPGWERYFLGQEGSTASVLKINGRAPGPYQKKKKKKFWQVAIPILTGAVGANLKNKYDDIEPTEWIDSPMGTFSRGDKNLTVSFDYETAPNSSDVLISIRIRSSWNTSVAERYLNTALGDSNTKEDFHLIKVPPVERDGLSYVGPIDVSNNPNYPHGAVENYTFIAKGVPAGQVRRIGGPNGIIVENDDLIIVKHTNPGGTQAAVGNDWLIINTRNNVKKGTYSVDVPIARNNIVSASHVNDPLLYDEIIVRFYNLRTDSGGIGDWYKVYNLNGVLEGFVASDQSSKYATTLERGAPTDEEAETINLITGDYNPYFAGSLTKPGSNENTTSWSRRPDPVESLSVYRAMMLDRLCLTTRPLTVFEGPIKILPGQLNLSYLHTLVMSDIDNMRMRIVRFSFEDYSRIASVTAIEVKYEEIPASELRQDAYIPGQGALNVIPGQGDGYYPTKSDSTNGRISAEDLPPTTEELEDLTLAASGRQGVIFAEIKPLVYLVGTKSTAGVDLIDYVSEQFSDLNEQQEEDDKFDLTTLKLTVIDKPTWVSAVVFDLLEVVVTALASVAGDYYITLNAFEPESETNVEFKLPIQAINKTIVTVNLLDKTTDTAVIGLLPGFYLDPAKIDFDVRVKGIHNLVVIDFVGGGPSGDAVNLHREFPTNYQVNNFTYQAFLAEAGIVAPVGIYTFHVHSYFEGDLRAETVLPLTLYDEEYLSKYSAELWDTTKDELLGVINPDGSSVFKLPVSFDPKSIIAGLPHNKVVFSFAKDGEPVLTKTFTSLTVISDAVYNLFGEVVTIYKAGKYDLLVEVFLDDAQNYQRLVSWAIQAEPPKPEAGVDLITFGQNVVNYTLIESLPLVGATLDLPDNYGFKIPIPDGIDCDAADWKMYDKTGGSLVNYDIELRTGSPQSKTYIEGQDKEDILLFGLKNSTEFPGLHRAPSSLRVVVTFRKGGEIVAIRQGEVTFRTPLEPGDYSGVRFITNTDDSPLILDANMAKAGGQYLLPETGRYSVSVREIDGLLFNKIVVRFAKKFGDSYVEGHMFDPYAVLVFTSPTEINETPSEYDAALTGWPGDDGRTLTGPDGIDFNIDEVGSYKATFIFSLDDELVGIKETEFEIIDGTPEDLPITDCCGSGEELVIIPGVSGTYGDESTVPRITIDDYGRITSVEIKPISIDWGQISAHPTTISGYGITDAYTKVDIDGMLIGSISGTVNRIPMFVTSHILGDSPMQVSGGRVTTLAIHEAKSFESTEVASATIVTGYSWMNGTLPRWQLGKVGAETGANLGSDLYLSRFNDAGAFDGNVFSISRQTSIVSFNYVVAGQTPTASNHLATKGYIDTALLGYVPKTRTIKINDITHDLSTDVVFNIASSVAGTTGRLLKFTSSSTAGDSLATESSGRITVAGISEAANFESNQAASDTIVGGYSWKNGATIHWQLGKIGTHSGGNTGSNLILARFNDAGSYDGNIFEISRQTAILNFNYVVSGQTPTAPSHLTTKGYTDTGDIPGITAFGWGNHALAGYGLSTAISGTAGKIMKFGTANTAVNSIMSETGARIDVAGLLAATTLISNAAPDPSNPTGFTFANGASLRWTLGKYGSETGSNAGSDLLLSRYSDAGGFNGDVFSISRAAGITTFSYVVRGPGPSGNDDYTPKYYVDNAAYAGQVAYGWGNHAVAGYALASALSGYSLVGHTHVAANITDFTAASRLTISGSGIDYNNTTGVIHLTNSNVIDAIGYFPYNSSNPAGYISGINSSMVTAALGYTPYNATNPAGYITSAALTGYATESYVNSRGFITGITSSNIVDALGYFPYNASNPSGYITSINSGMIISALGYTPMRDDRQITFNGTTYNLNSNPNLGSVTGGVTGSGNAFYLAKYTANGTNIGNSRIYDSGSGSIYFNGADTHGVYQAISARGVFTDGIMIGGNYSDKNSSAAFQINSTTQGLQLPVMTESQMNAISNPQLGLVVCVSGGSGHGLWMYEGAAFGWRIYATRVWSSTGVAP